MKDRFFFIVFSDDWGEHPSSSQHLFKVIGKQYKVLWVNTIGMRRMRFTKSDYKKALLKVRKMFRRKETGSEAHDSMKLKVNVIQPFMLPFVRSKLVRMVNAISVVSTIRRKLKDFSGLKPIVVTTVPNACDYVHKLDAEKVVYYCVDDFSEWPGLERDVVRGMEEDLIRKSDCFVATSSMLYKKLVKVGKPISLLTHGVDFAHFNQLPESEHILLKDIPKPRLGYYGLFDERFDQELIFKVASNLSGVSVVITGVVQAGTNLLSSLDNVFFTGPVKYEELPSLVSGFDICFIPYKINKLTESINPLKLKEYVSTGKPVLSTPISEIELNENMVIVAESCSDWCVIVERILGGSLQGLDKSDMVKLESWIEKKDMFIDFVYKACFGDESCSVKGREC